MKTLYVFLLCLYTSLTVAAQPLCQIKHFSVNSGLSQGVVVNIMQDKKGFLWFATWNGLNKFDGYTFKNYKAFPGDGCTLTTNRFSYIQKAKTEIYGANLMITVHIYLIFRQRSLLTYSFLLNHPCNKPT